MRTLAIVALFALTALAGCSDGGDKQDSESSTTTTTHRDQDASFDPCPTVSATTTVTGWTRAGGQWGPVASYDGHTDVVCGKALSSLNSLVDFNGPFGDLELNVDYVMVSGTYGTTAAEADKTNAGAGVVIHYADDKNYNIVRYSPREEDWHLFTMINGTRTKQNAATVLDNGDDPAWGQWIDLKVVSQGGHVTAFSGAKKVIDYTLPGDASHGGRTGYFLRDKGMVALYDGFSVTGS